MGLSELVICKHDAIYETSAFAGLGIQEQGNALESIP